MRRESQDSLPTPEEYLDRKWPDLATQSIASDAEADGLYYPGAVPITALSNYSPDTRRCQCLSIATMRSQRRVRSPSSRTCPASGRKPCTNFRPCSSGRATGPPSAELPGIRNFARSRDRIRNSGNACL